MLLQEVVTGNFLAQILPIAIILAVGFLLLLVWVIWIMGRRSEDDEDEGESETRSGDEDGLFASILGGVSSQVQNARRADGSGPATAASPRPMQAPDDDAVEVFRVLRDLADGSLIVDINGTRYQRLADITDAQVGRRFMANARALAHFALLLKGSPPPAPPPETPVRPPQPEPPVEQEPQRPAPGAGVSWPESDTSQQVKPAPMRPLLAFRQRSQNDDEEPAELISVADQIEEMLQIRLSQHPTLSRMSIHVRPSLAGGVRIVVGDTSYEAVDEVPDPEIRGLIQQTIQEWNARN